MPQAGSEGFVRCNKKTPGHFQAAEAGAANAGTGEGTGTKHRPNAPWP